MSLCFLSVNLIIGLFESGIALVVNQWPRVKGTLPCKYTQRILPEGIKLDLFFAEPNNWGLIYAIRTGSARYSHKVLAIGWVKRGFKSINGRLCKGDDIYAIQEEKDLFKLLGIPFKEPCDRH